MHQPFDLIAHLRRQQDGRVIVTLAMGQPALRPGALPREEGQ